MNYFSSLLISTAIFLLIPFKASDIKESRIRLNLNIEFADHINVMTSHPLSNPIKKSPDGKGYQISLPIGMDYIAVIKTESDANSGFEMYAGVETYEDKDGKGGNHMFVGLTRDPDGIRQRQNALPDENDGGGPGGNQPTLTEQQVQQMILEGRARVIHDNLPNTYTEIPFIPPHVEESQVNDVNVTQPSAAQERYSGAIYAYYLENHQLIDENAIQAPTEIKASLKQKHKKLVNEKSEIVEKQKAVREEAIKEITLLQVNSGTSSSVSFDFTPSAAKNLVANRKQELIIKKKIKDLEKSIKFNEGLLNIVMQYSDDQ